MPSIAISHEFDRRLRIVTVSGEVRALDILPHIGSRHPEAPLMTLWDFVSGSLCFGPDEVGGLPVLRSPASQAGKPPKSAVLCPNELDQGLFRILRVFAQALRFPGQVRMFRNVLAARRWLGACDLCAQQSRSRVSHSRSCPRHCLRASC